MAPRAPSSRQVDGGRPPSRTVLRGGHRGSGGLERRGRRTMNSWKRGTPFGRDETSGSSPSSKSLTRRSTGFSRRGDVPIGRQLAAVGLRSRKGQRATRRTGEGLARCQACRRSGCSDRDRCARAGGRSAVGSAPVRPRPGHLCDDHCRGGPGRRHGPCGGRRPEPRKSRSGLSRGTILGVHALRRLSVGQTVERHRAAQPAPIRRGCAPRPVVTRRTRKRARRHCRNNLPTYQSHRPPNHLTPGNRLVVTWVVHVRLSAAIRGGGCRSPKCR